MFLLFFFFFFFFFQAEDGIRDHCVTGVQTCALPILPVSIIWKIGPPLLTTPSRYPGGDRSVDSKWPWRTPIVTRLTILPADRTAIWLTLLISWRTERAPISINGISSISATFGISHSLGTRV